MLHAKMKGTLGELKVTSELIKKGYAVFTEVGDLSRIDLIAWKDDKLIKIQVKSLASKNGSIEIHNYKSGPNYRYKYTKEDVDIFAIYSPELDEVFYISINEILKR